MNIYLDDNKLDPILARMLRQVGHTVIHPADVGLMGASDARHLEHAIRAGLVVLTSDSVDFRELNDLVVTCGGKHPGILVVRYDNDAKRDMKPKHIVRAVGKLEKSGVPIANKVTVLNHWR
jgi:predicted nuclease of predicted toxin-antitoxin system